MIWNTTNCPKMAYCTYSVVLNRLPTRERCAKWYKNMGSINYHLCKKEAENIDHLLFDCSYSNTYGLYPKAN